MGNIIDYQEVFVPGGFPYHTYNPRESLSLETKFKNSLKNLCKLIVITGHTKSGKTVLARKILPQDQNIWIDGGAVSKEDEFWQIVVDNLDLAQEHKTDVVEGTGKNIGIGANLEANVIVTKASGQLGWNYTEKHENGISNVRTTSSRVVALQGLKERKIPLIIDDFHYLPFELQGTIIRALKQLIFDGLPVIIIAIPHRRYDAMKVEREMTGRIMPINIPVWSVDELQFIPNTGFSLLGYSLSHKDSLRLANEAIGSPHLMQDFCRTICNIKGINSISKITELNLSDSELETVFHDVAETMGRPMFEKLAHGPRQRTDRIQREIIGGQKVDIYQLVIRALANLKPGLTSLEYEDIRTSMRELSPKPIPQLHEVTRVLRHMATIASSDRSSTPVIDFEESEKKLHVTDPFFAFYLRWGDITN
jgi:hypothetical protein